MALNIKDLIIRFIIILLDVIKFKYSILNKN
jgi:hypothetical protein